MNKHTSPAAPAQSFAVSHAPPPCPPVNSSVPPFPIPADLDRLEAALDTAWRRWWHLFRAPDVWTNAAAKREMCAARLEYQDRVFDVAAAYAALPPRCTG